MYVNYKYKTKALKYTCFSNEKPYLSSQDKE